ncbi:MAG: hypothetical protein A2044_03895 [Candidatus Firestonebacteria bacterium GWA2_43_8]|nr:MAG: hypothetical protein A2044_03895 [Candidatus Firestonebacteria bacterium GWA2_43_8]
MLKKIVKNIVLASKNQFEIESMLVGNLKKVPADIKIKNAEYVIKKQNKDGGFSGRLGSSDMYYTAFAVKIMTLLGAGGKDFWKKAGSFAWKYDLSGAGLTELVSYLQVIDILEKKKVAASGIKEYRTNAIKIIKEYEDKSGGFMKSPVDKRMSLYNSFLAMLCLSKLKEKYPNIEKTAAKILKRQMKDGGFSDLGYDSCGQTNPSAAAVMSLFVFDRDSDAVRKKAVKYFVKMQDKSGGFLAHAKAPVSDLLSTYTALITLKTLGETGAAGRKAALEFVRSLMFKAGGFKSVRIDNDSDIEYTYYGLGCLGLLEN